jgi:hypothetical protein
MHTYKGDGYGRISQTPILVPAADAHEPWAGLLLAVVFAGKDLTGLHKETDLMGSMQGRRLSCIRQHQVARLNQETKDFHCPLLGGQVACVDSQFRLFGWLVGIINTGESL